MSRCLVSVRAPGRVRLKRHGEAAPDAVWLAAEIRNRERGGERQSVYESGDELSPPCRLVRFPPGPTGHPIPPLPMKAPRGTVQPMGIRPRTRPSPPQAPSSSPSPVMRRRPRTLARVMPAGDNRTAIGVIVSGIQHWIRASECFRGLSPRMLISDRVRRTSGRRS